ncbi:PP2C family protein-serine/threonine phosphatase [Streptomyces sp. CC210A]|uniref:PP2C family protein-serine/threonine phosphatase n=1 Tax=Streptomyces sp. CC210A TaxID=2898184 RepID=UPI001F36ACFE|nr:SpoIIE family protein phosphatase [Streptomyces sp. CC210A]
MPSHLFADRPSQQPPERGAVDALISQTRRLRGEVDAVRRDAAADEDDPRGRWQRALCDLAVHQLEDLDAHLGQLRDGLPPGTPEGGAPEGRAAAHGSTRGARPGPRTTTDRAVFVPGTRVSVDDGLRDRKEPDSGSAPRHRPDGRPSAERTTGALRHRVGSAEWNLLTDEVSWSDELFRIFGRDPSAGALTLDELPSLVFVEDQALLTQLVTGCLIDGRPLDGEFRIVRGDGAVRTVHMTGEPVLDGDGCTASMWAVLRDVSELRRSERTVRESRASLHHRRAAEQAEHRAAAEFQDAVLPPWHGPLRLAGGGSALDVAGHLVPSRTGGQPASDWYEALELPGGDALLTVGDLPGHGVPAASGMAMLLGALRGLAVAGFRPGALLGHLNTLIDSSAQPAPDGAVCCRYEPATRTLRWAQAGHPAPLLFRGGRGTVLPRPEGALLGATAAGGAYAEAEVRLEPGDVLLLHTTGLARAAGGPDADTPVERLLGLGARFARARDALDCVHAVVEEFGGRAGVAYGCAVVARVGGLPA